jgi:AraC-like DNA-binding protein
MKAKTELTLFPYSSIQHRHSGYFISRGEGIHPTRTIDSTELIVVHEGVLHIREETREYQVQAGQSLVLFPGREHGGTADYDLDLRFYWIHFNLDPGQSGKGQRIPTYTTVSRPDRLVQLFRWYLDDQESGRLQPHTASLLIALMLEEVADPRPGTEDENDPGRLLASQAMQHMRLHFHKDLTTAGIADVLQCNPDYLGRIFKRLYGQTLTEAIHRERLRYARRLLLDGRANVNEVAIQSGYSDPGYFRRVFKKMEGMTPGAYRRLYSRMYVNTE